MASRARILAMALPVLLSTACSGGGSHPGSGTDGGAGVTIAPTTLPDGWVGVSYSQALTASGGTAPYTFAVSSGSLPAGLSLSSSGALSGTPTAAGPSAFAITATDSSTPALTASESYSVSIAASGGPLTVTTATLPNGVVGSSYAAALVAGGGVQPYHWTVTAGSLPAGITLASSGTLSGTPTAAGLSSFTMQVSDSAATPATASAPLAITVLASSDALQIVTSSLPGGNLGSAYSAPLLAAGGTGPYQWSLSSGALPPGVALGTDGLLTGLPGAAGSYTFTAQATDSSSPKQTAQKQFTVLVGTAPLTLVTVSLPNGVKGQPYSTELAANGGQPPYAWSVASGALPPGLALGATSGTVSGTPTATGGYSFTIQVADVSIPQKVAQQSYSVTIASASQALVITTQAAPAAVRGVPYWTIVSAIGGTPPYTFSVSGGALPDGLTMNARTGDISGTPVVTGSFSFTAKVVDSSVPAKNFSAPLTIAVYDPLAPVTSALPDGTLGTTYAASISAGGGLAPYAFALAGGSLPAGLSLDASGNITGTPTALGSFGFSVQIVDSANPKQTILASFFLEVTAGLVVGTSSLPGAIVNVPYSQALTASGGTGPYTWWLANGTLPPGLALAPSTGILSGTPSVAGAFTFTVEVKDSSATPQTATRQFTVIVAPAALTVTTVALPGAVVGRAYSAALAAASGTAPYTWAVSGGSLPAGLTLDATTGAISGTPTGSAGTSTFTATVTDAAAATANQILAVAVTDPLGIATDALAGGDVGTAYSASIVASGGTVPATWSVIAGELPPGLLLDPATGTVSGTPTAGGSFGFTAQAVDASAPQQSAAVTLEIAVTSPFAIATTSLPNGAVGVAYSAAVLATGGTAPYTFSVGSGLPPGLALGASTGDVTGTPTTAGTYTFTVTATDSSATPLTASATFQVTIGAANAVTITTSSLPDGVTGTAYSAALAAAGGTAPYAWAVTSGSLPTGLSLAASTGAISGTPTVAGSYTFTVTATDSSATPVSGSATFTVIAAAPLAITTASLPAGTLSVVYSAAVQTTGGTAPLSFTVTQGALPPGLALGASTGAISGTPTRSGSFTFTVTATDAASPAQSASHQYTVQIL